MKSLRHFRWALPGLAAVILLAACQGYEESLVVGSGLATAVAAAAPSATATREETASATATEDPRVAVMETRIAIEETVRAEGYDPMEDDFAFDYRFNFYLCQIMPPPTPTPLPFRVKPREPEAEWIVGPDCVTRSLPGEGGAFIDLELWQDGEFKTAYGPYALENPEDLEAARQRYEEYFSLAWTREGPPPADFAERLREHMVPHWRSQEIRGGCGYEQIWLAIDSLAKIGYYVRLVPMQPFEWIDNVYVDILDEPVNVQMPFDGLVRRELVEIETGKVVRSEVDRYFGTTAVVIYDVDHAKWLLADEWGSFVCREEGFWTFVASVVPD